MNETRRKPTTGRQSPSLFDKWHGIFYMPSRTDKARHTKAFDYPVVEHWSTENRNVQPREDSNRQHIGPQLNTLPTEQRGSAGDTSSPLSITALPSAERFSSAGGTRTDNTLVRSRTRYQPSHPGSCCGWLI